MKFIECKLSELGEIVGGSTPFTKNESYYGGDIPWLTPKDLANFNGRYINFGERNITEAGYKSTSVKMLPINSVLFSSRAPIGYVAINNKNEVCTNQGFKSVIPNSKTDYMFLYYLLKYNKNKIEAMGSGTTFKEVSSTVMKNIIVNVPEAKEDQIKIGKILSKIDDKIELNTQTNDNLQNLINSLYIKYFVNFDEYTGEYKNSDLGMIPESFEVDTLGNVITFSNGYGWNSKDMLDTNSKGTYKVFKMGNINIGGGINKAKTKSWIEKDKASNLEQYITKKGDILMCMTDMKNSGNPLLGHTALIDKDDEFVINQRVGIIRCNKGFGYSYIYTMSNLKHFIKDIRSRANSGVQVNLTTKGICDTLVLVPDDNTLNKFQQVAEPLYEKMFNNNNENEILERLRDTLLPKLMNGEIDLDKIEI